MGRERTGSEVANVLAAVTLWFVALPLVHWGLALVVGIAAFVWVERARRREWRAERQQTTHKEILRRDIATLILAGKQIQQALMDKESVLEQTPKEMFEEWVHELVCYFRSNLPSEAIAISVEVPGLVNVRVAAKPDRAEIVLILAHRLERLAQIHARIPALDLDPPSQHT